VDVGHLIGEAPPGESHLGTGTNILHHFVLRRMFYSAQATHTLYVLESTCRIDALSTGCAVKGGGPQRE